MPVEGIQDAAHYVFFSLSGCLVLGDFHSWLSLLLLHIRVSNSLIIWDAALLFHLLHSGWEQIKHHTWEFESWLMSSAVFLVDVKWLLRCGTELLFRQPPLILCFWIQTPSGFHDWDLRCWTDPTCSWLARQCEPPIMGLVPGKPTPLTDHGSWLEAAALVWDTEIPH